LGITGKEAAMPRRPPIPKCAEKDRHTIEEWATSRTLKERVVERAQIVKRALAGEGVTSIARALGIRPNTVITWRDRFDAQGILGLHDKPRSGKPRTYGAGFRQRVLKTLELPPPPGQARWDGPALARHVGASADAVWRVLRKEGVCLARRRSWCVSTDPEFAAKAADIVGLYLNPPENALVLSVDEKPSIQALERATGYVYASDGRIVRGLKSTYKRHGTLNLCAALEVATGAMHTQITTRKRRVEFLAFMDQLLADLPVIPGREMHVILDNYCVHKRNAEWLAAHPTVTFHFTPASASWLNQVEIWFGILSRKALKDGSFRNVQQLREAIEAFIAAYRPTAKPFVWRKRDVKGAQLKNAILNLCN
jgi:transposase